MSMSDIIIEMPCKDCKFKDIENIELHKKLNEYKETLEVMSDKNATAAIIKQLRKELKEKDMEIKKLNEVQLR